MSFLSFLQSIDAQVLAWVRQLFFCDTQWFRGVILTLGDAEPILFALFLVGLWIYARVRGEERHKVVALNLFWHVLGAFIIYWILNHLLPVRPRPELMSTLPPLINHLPDNSFPSGHALFWGASWWAVRSFVNTRTAYVFLCVGFLTCLSRVVAGIHYPGDIIVGFLLGWGLVAALRRLPHGRWFEKICINIPRSIAASIGL